MRKNSTNTKGEIINFQEDLSELKDQFNVTKDIYKYIAAPFDNDALKKKIDLYQNKVDDLVLEDIKLTNENSDDKPIKFDDIDDNEAEKIFNVPVFMLPFI